MANIGNLCRFNSPDVGNRRFWHAARGFVRRQLCLRLFFVTHTHAGPCAIHGQRLDFQRS